MFTCFKLVSDLNSLIEGHFNIRPLKYTEGLGDLNILLDEYFERQFGSNVCRGVGGPSNLMEVH